MNQSFAKIVFISVLLLLFAELTFAQKAWEKDWQKLKKEDVFKILDDSPWAKGITSSDINAAYGNLNGSGFSTPAQRNAAAPSVVLRIYSSIKIRQASLRLNQIIAKYDDMSDAQKKEYDEKTKNFLDCEKCKDFYIFVLYQGVSDSSHASIVAASFSTEEFSFLKDKISLINDQKEKRELAQFIAPKTRKDPAIFLFAKTDENKKELITAATKKITVKFLKSAMRKEYWLQDFDFDVSKMLIDGKLDF